MRISIRFSVAVLALAIVGAGCSGGMRVAKASYDAYQLSSSEQASIEVCLDRLGDIDAGLNQVNDLLFNVPVSSDPNSIKALTIVDPKKIDEYTKKLKAEGPYSQPGRSVTNLKIYVTHNAEMLPAAKQMNNAQYKTLMVGVSDLGGKDGEFVTSKYSEVQGLKNQIADLEEKIGGLEVERDKEGTDEARQLAIDQEIANIETSIGEEEARVEPAEEALFAAVGSLKAASVDPNKLQAAANVFEVLQYAALIEIESLVMALVVGLQTVQAAPNLHNELQSLAGRWISETIADVTGSAKNAANIKPELDIGANGISFKLAGAEGANFDIGIITDKLVARVTKFYDDAVAAPGRVSSITSKVTFQVEFLASMAEAFASLAGTTYSETPAFVIPAAVNALK